MLGSRSALSSVCIDTVLVGGGCFVVVHCMVKGGRGHS
jgi:hypothetical protein